MGHFGFELVSHISGFSLPFLILVKFCFPDIGKLPDVNLTFASVIKRNALTYMDIRMYNGEYDKSSKLRSYPPNGSLPVSYHFNKTKYNKKLPIDISKGGSVQWTAQCSVRSPGQSLVQSLYEAPVEQ